MKQAVRICLSQGKGSSTLEFDCASRLSQHKSSSHSSFTGPCRPAWPLRWGWVFPLTTNSRILFAMAETAEPAAVPYCSREGLPSTFLFLAMSSGAG